MPVCEFMHVCIYLCMCVCVCAPTHSYMCVFVCVVCVHLFACILGLSDNENNTITIVKMVLFVIMNTLTIAGFVWVYFINAMTKRQRNMSLSSIIHGLDCRLPFYSILPVPQENITQIYY